MDRLDAASRIERVAYVQEEKHKVQHRTPNTRASLKDILVVPAAPAKIRSPGTKPTILLKERVQPDGLNSFYNCLIPRCL